MRVAVIAVLACLTLASFLPLVRRWLEEMEERSSWIVPVIFFIVGVGFWVGIPYVLWAIEWMRSIMVIAGIVLFLIAMAQGFEDTMRV